MTYIAKKMRNYLFKVSVLYVLLIILLSPFVFLYNLVASLIRLRNPLRAFWLTRHVLLSVWQDRNKTSPFKK